MSENYVPKRFRKPKKEKSINGFVYGIIMIMSVALAFWVALNFYIDSLPPINNLESFNPNIVTKIYSSDDEVIKTFTSYKFVSVDLKDVPEDLKNAVIATEDKNFYTHEGYDASGLARSFLVNLKSGRLKQGASTITQQLARILFLSNEKTFDRKIKEFIISARIEKSIPKDKILEMYLNNIYLGSSAYGVAAAAQIYFDKPLRDLTLAECALIAGLPQAPSVYSPFNNLKFATQRRNQVLGRMLKMQNISREDYEKATEEKITLNHRPDIYTYNKAPYFIDRVMKELSELGYDEREISQAGYKIYTTLDYQAQRAGDKAIEKNMNAYGLKRDKQQAAVLSISPKTGGILVYIGGKNYSKSQFDRVSQAVRPPGSAFKPFIYAAAIEKGFKPNDMIQDTPADFNGWSPKNYGNRYRGEIPLYKALMLSSNVAAAKLIKEVGVRSVINVARSLGLTTPLEYDYTIALGSNGVKLNEMTVAYGAFANGGHRVKPYTVERIETSRGKIIYQAPTAKTMRVMDINTVATLTTMMKTVLISGTGRAANINKPSAAKTGTTDDYRDAYFMGYTPDVVTGVWVGNDDNTKTAGLTGGTVPALIWKDIMKVATEKYGNVDFDYPPVEMNFTFPSSAGSQTKELPETLEKMDEQSVEELQPNLNSDVIDYQKEAETPSPTSQKFTGTFVPEQKTTVEKPVTQPVSPPVPPPAPPAPKIINRFNQ